MPAASGEGQRAQASEIEQERQGLLARLKALDAAEAKANKAMAVDGTGKELNEGQPPSDTDHANYFCEYAYLYHQMDMLEDSHRTGSYFNAIMWNPGCFAGKVVLDVGAGSGILSIMAARAGAKMVYAVEATDMAAQARRIVEANGLGQTVTILQGTVETVELPCKVDVIISEWMGYFLLRESMLDSVIVARDRFLKPGGCLFPSHATLFLAPLGQVKALHDKLQTWEGEKEHWDNFASDMKNWYDTDFSCVQADFIKEQRKYYLETGSFVNLTPKHLAGPARPLFEMDLLTLSLEELKNPTKPLRCAMKVAKDGPIEGFTGYFDAFFRGSAEIPVEQEVTLTTAPTSATATHWGQQLFGFWPPLPAKRGDTLECEMFIRRQERNHRLLRLECKFVLSAQGAGSQPGTVKETREETYYVD